MVCVDEIGHYSIGAAPDNVDPGHDHIRKNVLWANLMAGGAGVEWYFGYKNPHGDLNCEDWRSRDALWDQTRYALNFFQMYTNFTQMSPHNELISSRDGWCFSLPGEQYVIYLKNGGTTNLKISDEQSYQVYWYNPRKGGDLLTGSQSEISGPGMVSVGNSPAEENGDWAVLVVSQSIQN